jgi:hypothetical protein
MAPARRLKSGLGHMKQPKRQAQKTKKKHPNPQVTVFNAEESSYTAVEQAIVPIKRRS